MSPTHPFTNFSFFFPKKYSKVFLTKIFLSQYFMYSVNYLKRQVNRLANLWIYQFPTLF